ncbi:HpcH/HpaI aldolase/citrate lyase family protein [Acidobacteriota bacterium]
MNEHTPMRSALFAPGNRSELIDKAVNTAADVVIIDLEDAVPPDSKGEARINAHEKVAHYRERQIIVRVNGIDSDFIEADLDAVVIEDLWCLMVPKVEDIASVQTLSALLSKQEEKKGLKQGIIKVVPLIETAQGVNGISAILSESSISQRLITCAFGAADYTLDMGIVMTLTGEELLYPRSRIAVACRATGLEPPLDSPYMIDIKDVEGLKSEALRAKQLGFQGKLCVHPTQIEPCNQIFSPTPEEIHYAEKVIQAFGEAKAKGLGALQLDGKFIDEPIVEKARRVMEMAAFKNNT